MDNAKTAAFKFALKKTMPIMTGFLFIGITYGVYMHQEGFNFLYPTLMAFIIFAGSLEFVVASLLIHTFHPLSVFLLALIINSRHLFYSVSMLEKYNIDGWKKYYMIFGMCDESFSVNYTTEVPEEVDHGWFMFYVTCLNHFYWVFSSMLGGLFGSLIHFNLNGLSFVMTALFIVLFVDQLIRENNHVSSLCGVLVSSILLVILGKEFFLPLSMLLITLIFYIKENRKVKAHESS
ncbi:branched-chain amino acid transporter [Liquorilactobacillus aquaticus DSM 21051]|uniref:Branched-chain amino acid transporter n=1 Tax=Liquorilactobacillus aquaticus DSM 21051 TaxID=1423725 RepID=A0A0R2CUQ5_9LACO|nr:AzlC family ABC transporter permease [Liquorilactobacillus aquaticus]KRM95098.1 branched-chain amino acid transporter [Liquorilactobacillus aquaticus DSM 21051]